MADRKVLILAALLVVLLGVGAFQFLRGPEGASPPDTPRPEPKPKMVEKPTPPAADLQTQALGPVRDPFVRPDSAASPDAGMQTGKGPDGARFIPPEAEKKTTALSPKDPMPPLAGGSSTVEVEQALNGCGWEAQGVVVGPVPIAVLRDAQGEIVLVRKGQKPDPATRVVEVTPRSVTVRHVNRTVTLAIGGGVVGNKK